MSIVRVGQRLDPETWTDIHGESVSLPDSHSLIHLQFRRFAGCPICHRHLHSFANAATEVKTAGIKEVVVFHSSREVLLAHSAVFPFVFIADPERVLYRRFGVERSLLAMLDPRTWWAAFRGILAHGMRVPDSGGALGLPADIMLDSHGRVIACHYGRHANDHWSVSQVLELAQAKSTLAHSPAHLLQHG